MPHSPSAVSSCAGDQSSPPPRKTSSKLSPTAGSPLDINSPAFDPEVFVSRLVTEASLGQLMAQEGEIVRQIQGLDSDMQTLVYENYNKFIAATETIRKMRVDFRSMEEEMDQLAGSMTSITTFSAQISDKLRTRRQEVRQGKGVEVKQEAQWRHIVEGGVRKESGGRDTGRQEISSRCDRRLVKSRKEADVKVK